MTWQQKKDYSSPPDPYTIDKNLMWMKHFVKGVAEGLPNIVWVMAFQALNKTIENWQSYKIMKVDNLNEAYALGRRFGKELLGGDYF